MTAARDCPSMHRRDQLQYYDWPTLCSDGWSLRELSTGLKFTGLFARTKIESVSRFRTPDDVATPAFAPNHRVRAQTGARRLNRAHVYRVARGSSSLADIFVQCPRTGALITTGLKTEWVLLKSLPRVPIPVHCPVCGQMHKWMPQDASIGPTRVAQASTLQGRSRAAS